MHVLSMALAAAAILTTSAFAQVSSPPGFLSSEGTWRAMFGWVPEGRYMFVDGEHLGRPTVVKEVAYRQDDYFYTSIAGAGRSWASVTLDYAPCNAKIRTAIYSAVQLSTPTRVFSSAVAWPEMFGRPASLPAAWGGPGGALRFPFSRTIVTTGQDDLSFDYQFRGGALQNASSWTVSPYLLDGYNSAQAVHGSLKSHGAGWNGGGCSDAGNTSQLGAVSTGVSVTYGPGYQDPRLRNQIHLSFSSQRTAASAPVVHAVGLDGSPWGVRFPGVTCNGVHVNFLHPVAVFARVASVHSVAKTDFGAIPYQRSLAGLTLWFQPAWNDSVSGAVKLGAALEATVAPAHPEYRRWVIWEPTPTAPSGLLSADGVLNPIVRFGR